MKEMPVVTHPEPMVEKEPDGGRTFLSEVCLNLWVHNSRRIFAHWPGPRVALVGAIAILLTVFCLSQAAFAQSPEPVDILKIDTDLVSLNVSVFDRNSRNPKTLEQKDFAVLDNGAAQEISFFASNETPFDLVLLLDLSGSTAKKIELIRKSAKRFVDATRAGDRVGVVTFSGEVHTVAKLTSDRAALKESIDGIEKPVGGTNFWDALMFVLDHVTVQSRAEHRRSAVVVMTDGVDNAIPGVYGDGSRTTFERLIENVRKVDTIVIPVYLDTEKEANPISTPHSAYAIARDQLVSLALESGNVIYRAAKLSDLDKVYGQVIRDLGMVYSIGYRPGNRLREGAWHNVTLRLIDHPELETRTKRGYYETRN
ncbi:MAG TPA: VWA domain-containing protein [Pyrinomonadaceae bacterium]|nr:VWA domain-containing protein [Pyrinomonadaceae bacterium]